MYRDQTRYRVVNNNKHDSSHVRYGDPFLMNIPIPAETPDPNIDDPTLPPPGPDPEPIPEKDPPLAPQPPKGDPPSEAPPERV
ncbi:hypothetical protein AB7M32_002925 [Pseudomonas sp. R151218B TE3479]